MKLTDVQKTNRIVKYAPLTSKLATVWAVIMLLLTIRFAIEAAEREGLIPSIIFGSLAGLTGASFVGTLGRLATLRDMLFGTAMVRSFGETVKRALSDDD